MQIKYTTQAHQTKAIESIVSLFQGQSRQVCEYDIFDGEAETSMHLALNLYPLTLEAALNRQNLFFQKNYKIKT